MIPHRAGLELAETLERMELLELVDQADDELLAAAARWLVDVEKTRGHDTPSTRAVKRALRDRRR